MLGIAAVAALLYALNITKAGYAPLYSTAVKSMSESWKAFFYGAVNVKATYTLDKLAGSFVPQAISARIFGFHAWSLALPQVIEGVISVLVMYRVVRRWAGVVPGLLAAGIFALTPIAASMFGHSMEDGLLTMCLVLAADCYQRAVSEARLRSLIWAGVWVGLGFEAKMLQAWVVLPAFGIAYLLTAPTSLRRRLAQLSMAGAVMLVVSLAWIALYTFTPAHDRPYITGSSNNNAFSMVFDYNGLQRFGSNPPSEHVIGPPSASSPTGHGHSGQRGSGGQPAGGQPAGGQPAHTGGSGTATPASGSGPGGGVTTGSLSGGSGGWDKLLGGRFGPEIGWLLPLALLSLILGLIWRRGAGRTDQVRGGLIMWGIWLLLYGLLFSAMKVVPHTAYVASLAPPIAALSGAGIVMIWRRHLTSDLHGLILPLAVAMQLDWAIWLWSGYFGFLPWALWSAVALGAVAIALLISLQWRERDQARLLAVSVAVAVVAMLAAPATWAFSVLDTKYAGTSFDASAGPDHVAIHQSPTGPPGASGHQSPGGPPGASGHHPARGRTARGVRG